MVRGSCPCGDVAWEADGPLEFTTHHHGSMCRKSAGAACSTSVAAPAGSLRVARGEGRIARFEAAPPNPPRP